MFLDLVDRSGSIQLLCRVDRVGKLDVDLGDIVGVVGSLTKTRRGEPSLEVSELTLLSKIRRPLPDHFHGLRDTETRYRQRYLDLLMSEETRDAFQLRARLVTALRRYLDANGFVEVETPILQPRYGGAFAEPFVTHSNELDQDLYLRIATELYLKRLIVGGLERVYEVGKDFRNESVSYKHQPEFTMLEWYEAYADYRDTMARIEACVRTVASGTCSARRRCRSAAMRSTSVRRGGEFASSRRSSSWSLWTRDEVELRAWLDRARGRHEAGPDLGPACRPRLLALRRARADRAVDRPRLSDRAVTVRAGDGRRSDD